MLALGLVLNTVSIGLFCWLIFTLAVYALPFFVLCGRPHKTEYVAPRVMLRVCDWALSHGRLAVSTQHNASGLRKVA
jgi:hypothetical protein